MLKFCFIKQKKRINFGKFSFLNKSFFFSKNKRKNLIFKENELILKHKGLLIRSIFYFKFFGYIYIKHYLNCKNKNNILLKYYFYFYDFIIKIFIKLLNNFKFIILNKALKGNLVKNFIWFKIAIIFLYYKKIIINKMSNKLIRNFNLKATLAKFSKSENKLNFFLKNSSEFQKKIANEKLGLFKEDLDLRLDLVKKIKHYKKSSNSYYFFRLKVLQKIYSSLDEKINEFKKQKENGSLKLNKLYKFIKNSKLKKQVILKELAIVNTK